MPSSEAVFLVWGNLVGLGGTEKRMLEVLESVPQGYTLRVMSLKSKASIHVLEEFSRVGVNVELHPSTFAIISKIRQAGESPTVLLHGFRIATLFVVFKALFYLRAKLVWVQNGIPRDRLRSRQLVQFIFQNFVSLFLTNSDSVKKSMVTSGIRWDRVAVLHPALAQRWLEHPGKAAALGPIMIAANNRPEKNLSAAIEAHVRSGLSRDLHIYTDRVGALSQHIPFNMPAPAGRIKFFTGVELSPSDFDSYSIYLNVSLTEGRPKAINEAMARGLVVVAGGVGDIPEMIPPGKGIVLGSLRIDSIAEGLRLAEKLALSFTPVEKDFFKSPADYLDQLMALLANGKDT